MHRQKTRVFMPGDEQGRSRDPRGRGGAGKTSPRGSLFAAALAACRGRAVPICGTVAALGVVGAIVFNALWMQAGPHPAPLLARKPVADSGRSASETTGTLAGSPRARGSETAAVPAPRAEAAPPAPRPRPQTIEDLQREMAGAERRPAAPNPGPMPPTRPRRIEGGGSASPARVTAVQRALAEYGYGQLRPSGVVDDATKKAVESFERERKLPVTGQFSPRLLRELAAVTGRPIN